MVSPELQLFVFLVVVLLGMISGFIFDLQRVWRRLAQPGKWGRDIGDLLFVLTIGILIFAGLLLTNWGELRGFVFLALIGGIVLYFYMASSLVFRVLTRLFAWVWRVAYVTREATGVASGQLLRTVSRRTRNAIHPIKEPYLRIRGWARNTSRRLRSIWKRIDGFL